MSWPIGYGRPELGYSSADDGAVCADGVRVTARDGWIELPTPMLAVACGAPRTFALRLRVGADGEGRAFLYAEEVRVGAREYGGVFALLSHEGNFWAARLTESVFAAIERRRANGGADGPRITRSGTTMRSVRAPDAAPSERTTTRADTRTDARNRRSG